MPAAEMTNQEHTRSTEKTHTKYKRKKQQRNFSLQTPRITHYCWPTKSSTPLRSGVESGGGSIDADFFGATFVTLADDSVSFGAQRRGGGATEKKQKPDGDDRSCP